MKKFILTFAIAFIAFSASSAHAYYHGNGAYNSYNPYGSYGYNSGIPSANLSYSATPQNVTYNFPQNVSYPATPYNSYYGNNSYPYANTYVQPNMNMYQGSPYQYNPIYANNNYFQPSMSQRPCYNSPYQMYQQPYMNNGFNSAQNYQNYPTWR